jgi:general secretion pathway protein G
MDTKVTCPNCGQRLVVDSAAIGQQTDCPACSTRFVIPAIARVESSPLATPHDTRRRGAAVSSLVLGILSLLCFGILTGIPAIILGHKGYGRARKLPDQYAGGGMAVAGLIMGYMASLVSIALIFYFALVIPEIAGRSEQARITAATTDIKGGIKEALDAYEIDNGTYPWSLQDLVQQPSNAKNWHGPYLDPPRPPIDPWGNPYVYYYPSKHKPNGYDLLSVGPDGKEGTDDDIGNRMQ